MHFDYLELAHWDVPEANLQNIAPSLQCPSNPLSNISDIGVIEFWDNFTPCQPPIHQSESDEIATKLRSPPIKDGSPFSG